MSAWLAYLCAIQGHIRTGVGSSSSMIVWSNYCQRCGARLSAGGETG